MTLVVMMLSSMTAPAEDIELLDPDAPEVSVAPPLPEVLPAADEGGDAPPPAAVVVSAGAAGGTAAVLLPVSPAAPAVLVEGPDAAGADA